jgi:hypothetical protein
MTICLLRRGKAREKGVIAQVYFPRVPFSVVFAASVWEGSNERDGNRIYREENWSMPADGTISGSALEHLTFLIRRRNRVCCGLFSIISEGSWKLELEIGN